MVKTKNNLDKTEKILQDFEKRQDVVALQKFYVDAQVNNLPALVEEKKNEVINKIEQYKMIYGKEQYDDNGNIVAYKVNDIPPYVVSNYFFRSIINLQNIEPQYSGEHLAILWELYGEMVEQVNINLCEFTPTLSHFCRFIGLTSSGFKKMKNSPDEGIRIMAEKIYDSFYDNSVKMAELGKHNTRATIYRMKSELERLEKEQPNVVINATNINLDEINKRISEIGKFNSKVIDYNEKSNNE